jgi:FkbM family methyltransferase
MSRSAKDGVKYYPLALGERNERRKFYITQHPMCCSLYEPNDSLNSLYNNLEVAYLARQSTIETINLDFFAQEYGVDAIDFIKIDVQGAELDIFKGGSQVLKNVLAIVSEVEFIPHYVDQPLFGDVCAYLSQHDLMFHKFIGFGGRALKPIVINNDANNPSQLIWSDAIFIRHVNAIPHSSDHQLLKLSVLAAVYNSPELSYHCLAHYDQRNGTTLSTEFLVSSDE